MDDLAHLLVIGAYFHYAGGFEAPHAFDVSPQGRGAHDPLFVIEGVKKA